ncbi:tRNA dihydrouridine synthase DusB [Megasphaera vaginalis (ex Srinivasan et al. 2021)]|uniref:tRNA-dihydrouridine synthase n=1 Tax=Megasphaera vaginalis (ex Srinivasan et al. 2021) TaxID=1111454 RepID=U7UAU1_9FIRM|nr:tRNA dihydrouridine synthase DusB [Megasphaera vaginalis (ex Srinivasan et al. 2021)]ERT56460.1 TIM-barrel protein, nifR3 family [Megasphaera vaginalis (ex Srinivasan et al. 2021)]
MNEIVKPLRLGSLQLDMPVALAPMAGVCDLPYRVIARSYGAALVCTEMVSAKGICYHNLHTREMLRVDEREHPLSLQLFGNEPETMARGAAAAEEAGADVIDINMGCPVKKVVGNGEGAALLTNLPLATAIIAAVVRAVSLPVTVKMRTGWDAGSFTAPELAKRAEAVGAAAVIVHGRTREQFYGGKADRTKIKQVVDAVSIPVFGNGDICDGPTALQMFRETGCAGVMIGRGAQGNPWIFPQICRYLQTGEIVPPPSAQERYDQLLQHFDRLLAFKGDYIGLREMRSHAAWYTKGLYASTALRQALNQAMTPAEFRHIVEAARAAL